MYMNEDLLMLLDHDHVKIQRIKDIVIEQRPEIVVHRQCMKDGCGHPKEYKVIVEFDDLFPIIRDVIKELLE